MSQAPIDRAGEEAIAWMVRLRAGTPDARQQARFETWLNSDSSHQDAWARLQGGLGGHYDTLRSFERRAPGLAREALLQPELSRRNLLRGLAGLGLLGGGLWLGASSQAGQALMADLRTGTGERRRFTLADGSLLELNADSAVDLDVSTNAHLLHLRQGALVIRAAQGSTQPLVVRTRQGDVRTLGGRLLVEQLAESTRAVALERGAQASQLLGGSLGLGEGQAALLHARHIELLSGDQRNRAGWLQGRLNVLDEPLEAVIDALRPYRRGLIRVSPEVRQIKVQGVFPLDDPDRALTALGETLPIRVDTYGPWLTLISAAV
ncbi:membrane protein [Pseudomonas solani]|uniref:Membrane protein n=1 Tax=Pseudomonas solani TaxID=2731552 RepID=A0ABM7L7X6_9PSED|nr:FecR domain-containing protein [Pseudomonas solani]BCD85641.1 membrane protein [Pseudomonas solani]